jgi:hypothetical protein
LPQFPHFLCITGSSWVFLASTPVRSAGRLKVSLPSLPSGRTKPTGRLAMAGRVFRAGRGVSAGLEGTRLNCDEVSDVTSRGFFGIGRIANCGRGTEGATVEGRVAELKPGRVVCVTFGCVRDGAGRGVN